MASHLQNAKTVLYTVYYILTVLLKPKSNCESVLQIKYLTPKTAILNALPIKGGCALNNFLNLYFLYLLFFVTFSASWCEGKVVCYFSDDFFYIYLSFCLQPKAVHSGVIPRVLPG